MDRRAFLRNTTQLGMLLRFAPLTTFAQTTQNYRKWMVIDALCSVNTEDTIVKPEILKQAQQSGVTAIHWTISAPSFDDTVENISFVERMVENDPAHWTIVRRQSDFDRAKQERKIGILMGFQHPDPMGPDLKRLGTFRDLGVRVMQLTYNNRSLFGDGCLEPANAGLSKLGRAASAKMNELGIVVDLSHSGQRTTAEGIETSKKPVLITHSGCNAIHQHPRNKDDHELKALSDRGGVVGIYFMPYLVASPSLPTREHALAHLDHALKVAGTDHVGIGSDGVIDTFPDTPEQRQRLADDMENRRKLGIAAPEEDRPPYSPDLNTPDRMQIIAAGLEKRGYSEEVVEKVMGKNFYRALGEIWG
ncbi:MAG TPA: membrane dipeptidase [Terriglobales bacterium]|nr:membrane dipeptidase [Terriglobales bacterium]